MTEHIASWAALPLDTLGVTVGESWGETSLGVSLTGMIVFKIHASQINTLYPGLMLQEDDNGCTLASMIEGKIDGYYPLTDDDMVKWYD